MVILFWNNEGIETHGTALYLLFETMRYGNALEKGVQVFFGLVLHRLFTAAEDNLETYLVAFGEEFLSLGLFEKKIVLVCPEANADTFGLHLFLLSLLLLFLLGSLVLKFTVIGNFADGWLGKWRDLNEVSFLFLSKQNGSGRIHHPEVLIVLVDNHHLRNENLLVDSGVFFDLHLWLRSIVASSSHCFIFKNWWS